MARSSGTDIVEKASGKEVRDLFPVSTTEDSLVQMMHERVPKAHHEVVWECARHFSNTTHRALAVSAAALIAQQLYEPNSSFGMWASLDNTGVILGRGANAVPGRIYTFASYLGGALNATFNAFGGVLFTRGQRFFGLTTGPMDSNAGWTFVGNTVKLASDAISGIETDTSFVNWRPEIVKARLIKGEYEGFEITSETVIPFTAQAYLPVGIAAAPSIEGLSVLFWDVRCINKELRWMDRGRSSYEEIVADLIDRADAGTISRGLLGSYVPKHLRRR